MPGVCDAIPVECLVDIQQIIVAQRKENTELLQDRVHRRYRIGETCQRERKDAPERAEAHGESHLSAHPEEEGGKSLCSQYREHAHAYHRHDAAVAWILQIAVEIYGIEDIDEPEYQGLRQEFSHEGGERRVARYSIEYKLRIAFPFQSDGVGCREHHQEDEDSGDEHIVEIYCIIKVRVVERMYLYLDGLYHAHRLSWVHAVGIERFPGQG